MFVANWQIACAVGRVFVSVYLHDSMLHTSLCRCGMVYVDPKNLGYEPFWKKLVNDRPAGEQEWMMELYNKYVPCLIDMICEGILDGKQGEKLKAIVPLTNLNMVSHK